MYRHDINSYSKLTEIFSNTLEKHATLKFKTIRVNQVPFMTKKLSKAIMNKYRLRSKQLKWPSRENFLAYKKLKNKWISLNKKPKKYYFQETTKGNIMINKLFWNIVKPSMTNKGILTNDKIVIESEKDVKIKSKGKKHICTISKRKML